ncbi:MAG: ribosome small subunit-dependent GTPase A [Bacillota bacterium]
MSVTGIVTRTDGPRYWVDVAGEEFPCVLRGRLKKEQLRTSSYLAVGDRVELERLYEGDGGRTDHELAGAIIARLPRRTELSRPTSFRGQVHVMAANVDQMVHVQAAAQPAFQLRLAYRFQAAARRGGMEGLVVVNKCDLQPEALIRSWIEPLVSGGVPVVLTSTADGRGLDELRRLLAGRISVLAGKSGVGKSSLVNALYPEWQARTTDVSLWSSKGRHTTTSSRLYPLPGGGYLADTPGIRELVLFDDDDDAVTGVFAEIEEAAAGCRFRDCSHSHEPGCAVKAAVARGDISQDRYDSFLRMTRGA